MRPIGHQQRRILLMLASPATILLTPACAVTKSLIRRGLVRQERHGCRITPAGMRVAADEFEAGRFAPLLMKAPPRAQAKGRAKTRRRGGCT